MAKLHSEIDHSNDTDTSTGTDKTNGSESKSLFSRRGFLLGGGALGMGLIGLGALGTVAESEPSGESDTGEGGDSGGQATPQSTATATPTATATQSQYVYVEDGIGLVDRPYWEESEYGNLSLAGTAANVTDSMLRYVQISVAFLDTSGAQLQTSIDNTTNLAAGQQWRYAVMYPGLDTERVADAQITGIDVY